MEFQVPHGLVSLSGNELDHDITKHVHVSVSAGSHARATPLANRRVMVLSFEFWNVVRGHSAKPHAARSTVSYSTTLGLPI